MTKIDVMRDFARLIIVSTLMLTAPATLRADARADGEKGILEYKKGNLIEAMQLLEKSANRPPKDMLPPRPRSPLSSTWPKKTRKPSTGIGRPRIVTTPEACTGWAACTPRVKASKKIRSRRAS
jgi:hypothetical protein